ncbi:MAG: sigma-70 family RNA polymerase sigma factor [Actinobacteria bacterium]|nr:sigma-70 family RNA polymerase sigma factor [Actinomycetota bacterium]
MGVGGLAEEAVARAHREEWGRIVATLIRVTGDWTLAEDSAQDAFEQALARWGTDGVPSNPGAWLTTVAKNRAIDRIRRSATERAKLQEVMVMESQDDDELDDRLRLIFTCCHPALTLESRVALTLRTVAGLTTGEIARAFLVPEVTMAQRIVRAKAKIRNAGIPYRVPPGHLLGERLPGVLAVLYVLFTEGYSASSGDRLVREPLAEEAIWVTRLLALLMPDEPEVGGLLALMVLQHARRAGRTDAAGDPVSIEEQDRSAWDHEAIAEGVAILRAALRRHRVDRYQLQAVIAAEHATAPSWAQTDFRGIVRAYDDLARLDPSPVIAFNRAIAWGIAEGPEVGLHRLDLIADRLDGYYLLPAARADFLRRLGRRREAAEQYELALGLAPSEPETRFLERRLAEVTARE